MKQNKALIGCTSLKINDIQGNTYHGRTLEFEEDLPSNVEYHPVGSQFTHKAPDGKTDGLSYTSAYELLWVSAPSDYSFDVPMEGVNSAGLSASLNMKSDSELPELPTEQYGSSLHWVFLLEWALSNCGSIVDIKNKIADISLWSVGTPSVDPSYHFVFYDTTGASLVVEVSGKKVHVIDNPTGVMTNGPEFAWHLTNLNNYTHLNNTDVNTSTMGGMNLKQPDTGISAAALPSSDTSVDRFVRAVFYTSFVQKSDNSDKSIIELSHIMNKFDRPKNMTGSFKGDKFSTEFTVWTTLTDIQNKELYIRTYDSLNYQKFSMKELAKEGKKVIVPIVR